MEILDGSRKMRILGERERELSQGHCVSGGDRADECRGKSILPEGKITSLLYCRATYLHIVIGHITIA